MTDERIIFAAFSLGLAATAWLALARVRFPLRLATAAACLLAGLAGLRLAAATEPVSATPTEVAVQGEDQTTVVVTDEPRQMPLTGPNLVPLERVPPGIDDTQSPPADPAVLGQLAIPALGVIETIVPVRIRAGVWDVSELGQHVGWLETTGDRPGDSLAMALAGHATVTAVQAGAFSRLWKLPLNAEVVYVSAEGEYRYRVYDKRELQPDDVRPLYLSDGQVLQLVTCAVWDPLARDYSRRLLVRARLVSTPAPEPDLAAPPDR